MFTERSADLPAAQLTRPILQPPQACRPHSASFSSKSNVAKTLGPFDKQVSGLRLAHQDTRHAVSIVFYPQTPKQHQGPRQGVQGPSLPVLRLKLAHLHRSCRPCPPDPPPGPPRGLNLALPGAQHGPTRDQYRLAARSAWGHVRLHGSFRRHGLVRCRTRITLVYWLVDCCLVVWLVGWLAGWLVGWLVD